MTYAATLVDSPYAITTHAIVRLDPSPRRQAYPTLIRPIYATPEPPAPAESDEASLSQESVLIAHALTLSDVRTDKVARLRQAIASGTYIVSSPNLANRLIQIMLAQ